MSAQRAIVFRPGWLPLWKKLLALLLIVQVAQPVAADRWELPRTKQVRSGNRKFIARVVPANDDDDRQAPKRPARLSVYSAGDNGAPDGEEAWSVRLTNSVSPVSVMVTGDGRHVVTFDDWYAKGYGLNVLAFYGPKGQLTRYSLEELLRSGGIALKQLHRPQQHAFPESASSRWWRDRSVTLLDEPEAEQPAEPGADAGRAPAGRQGPHLCIWLGWAAKWLAWDVTTGDPREPAPAAVRRWNEQARDRMLKELEAQDGDHGAAAAFLGWLNDPRDRALLKRLDKP